MADVVSAAMLQLDTGRRRLAAAMTSTRPAQPHPADNLSHGAVSFPPAAALSARAQAEVLPAPRQPGA